MTALILGLEQALAADVAAGRRAEEIFLAWLFSLPADVDPSFAATMVLARLESMAPPAVRTGEFGRLCSLLEETMTWPRSILEPWAGQRRARRTQAPPVSPTPARAGGGGG